MPTKRKPNSSNFNKLSFSKLEKLSISYQRNIHYYEESLKKLQSQEHEFSAKLHALNEEIADIDQRISYFQKARFQRSGIMGLIFGGTEPVENAKEKIRELEKEKEYKMWSYKSSFEKLNSNIKDFESRLDEQKILLRKIQNEFSLRKRKKESIDNLRAIAASNTAEHRKVAQTIKREIKNVLDKQPLCPYCGGSLGPTPHADHIYPISKGGRSTIKNMVYVCSECNKKKGNMTLALFIRSYNLNRTAIETRLQEFDKDF